MKSEWDNRLQDYPEPARILLGETNKEINQLFRELCNDRNDINHAGFREGHSKSHRLRCRLTKNYKHAWQLLKQMGYLN